MCPTIVLLTLLAATPASGPRELRWSSVVVGADLRCEFFPAERRDGRPPLVVYLVNLPVPRIGRERDETILADLRRDGCAVLFLDYAKHQLAAPASINPDLLKLREDLAGKSRAMLRDFEFDANRIFILPEGYRLKQNVPFAHDGERELAMDVMYPADPERPVPLVMEISCDNANRMGVGSLLFCRDTLLEGALVAGFAGAMVDHPVAAPYKGIDDPMPTCLERMQSAVVVLREQSKELGLNGKIGAIGFSRGATFAAMLSATRDVDAAIVHGNRFDYLDLLPDDPMLARFTKAWGPVEQNRERWALHGAVHWLDAKRGAAPMFLNTSDAESSEYRDGLEKLHRRLTAMGITHEYQVDRDGRGHRVTTDSQTLQRMYDFLRKHLD
jgi:dienelactone hydrolase